MRGTIYRALARVVAVVGVLAGVVLALGMSCPHSMTAVMATEHVAASGMAIGTTQDYTAAVAMASARDGLPHCPSQHGVLGACLTFIVAAIAVFARRRTGALRIFVPISMSRRPTVIRTAGLRAPSLAELCLLRT